MEKQAADTADKTKKGSGKRMQTGKQSVRHIKVCKFTMRNDFNDIEETVNKEIDALAAAGHKTVSVTHFVVNSPNIYVIYNIIYE